MSVSTADKIFLCVGLINFGGMFIWFGVALHLAYAKMDLMLEHLKNCPAVMIRVSFNNGGPWGKLFVPGGIMGLMITPRIYLRNGGASPEDLNHFPVGIKRRLTVLHWLGCASMLLLFGVVAVDEFIFT